ncbi:Endoplasmic reticulum membrane protein [Trichophyton interdigitale]|nr:hypothetical protein H101_01612 [Trichophyton interdigitale H6]KAF3894854.1 Endoplasmic reticulum membrane protein [Trichophyton interdigitale]KAG5218911.1 Endoplasmic reticulum membrane protein [Trichophyton interdigitale]KAG8209763.1 Endoplasmic reticulum membrane protein [Trichophyton interdigitale]
MDGVFKGLFGGKATEAPQKAEGGFADFAPPSATGSGPQGTAASTVPYTKWYRVWERTSPQDFVQEAFIIPFIILVAVLHVWGAGKNRRKAKTWAQANIPVLCDEFAVVGYTGIPRNASSSEGIKIDDKILKEKALNEFTTYATGRQNIAFVDVTIKMLKRYNPLLLFGETLLGLFFDSLAPSAEKVEIVAYPFDGREKDLVPPTPMDIDADKRSKSGPSTYDGFVFAVVHKNAMRRLREDRYDVSLTFTKENAKLPNWLTVMSESAEITDSMLVPEFVKAIEDAGDLFDYLIVTDQPMEKPTTVEEAVPRKRIILSLRVPESSNASDYASSSNMLKAFIRLADRLVATAHFRPEVTRKLRSTREEEIKRMKRVDQDEKAEERKVAAEKIKKEERDRLLRNMSAEEQKKFLAKEKEREQKREMKRQTRKG